MATTTEIGYTTSCTWRCKTCGASGTRTGATAVIEASGDATAHVLTRHPDR
jgi:hypothetical protein